MKLNRETKAHIKYLTEALERQKDATTVWFDKYTTAVNKHNQEMQELKKTHMEMEAVETIERSLMVADAKESILLKVIEILSRKGNT